MKPGGNRRSKKQKEAKKMKQIVKKSMSSSTNEKEDEAEGKSTLSDASLKVLDQLFRDNSAEDILKLGPRPELLGMTPLAMAASVGNVEAVTKLLAADADVNEKSNKNATALMQITCSKNLDIAELLLENGASLTQTNKDGDNAFMLAVSSGDAKLVNKMWPYKKELDINHCNHNGNTALHLAAEKKWDNCIQFLLLNGSDVNQRNNIGWTPLFTAVAMGDLKTVEKITSAGSDLLIEDKEGNTVLCKAILLEKYDIANYISKRLTDLERELYCDTRVSFLQDPNSVTKTEVIEYYDETLFPVLLHLAKYDHFRSALLSSKVIYYLFSIASKYATNSQIVSVSCFICTMLMFRYSSGTDDRFVKQFLAAQAPNFLLSLLAIYENSSGGLLGDPDVTSHCFMCFVPMTESAKGQAWIRDNALRLSTYVEIVKNMNVITAYNNSMDEGCKFKLKMMWKKFLNQYEASIKSHREDNLASLLEEEEREKLIKDKKRDRRKLKKLNKKLASMCEYTGDMFSSGKSHHNSSDTHFDENNHSRHSSPSKLDSGFEKGIKEHNLKCDNLNGDSNYTVSNVNDIVVCISQSPSRVYDDSESQWVKVGSMKKTTVPKTVIKPPLLPFKPNASENQPVKHTEQPEVKAEKSTNVEKRSSKSPKSWADIAKGITPTSPECSKKKSVEPLAKVVKQNTPPLMTTIQPPSPIKCSSPLHECRSPESVQYFQEFPSLNDKTEETESVWGPYVQPVKAIVKTAQPSNVHTLQQLSDELSGISFNENVACGAEDLSFGYQLEKELEAEIQQNTPPGFQAHHLKENVEWWDSIESLKAQPPQFNVAELSNASPRGGLENRCLSNHIQSQAVQDNNPIDQISGSGAYNTVPTPKSSTKISFGIDEDILRSLETPKTQSLQNNPIHAKTVNSVVLNDGTVLNFNVPHNFVYENNTHHLPQNASLPTDSHLQNDTRNQGPMNYASSTMMGPFANSHAVDKFNLTDTYEGVTPPPKYPWPDRTQEYDDYIEQMWNSAMLMPSVFQLPKHLRDSVMPHSMPSDTVLYPESLREDHRDPETSSDYSTQSSDNNDIFPSFHDQKDTATSANFLLEELAKEQIKLQDSKIPSNSLLKDTVYHHDLDYYKSLYGLATDNNNDIDSFDPPSPEPEWAQEPHNPEYQIQTMPRMLEANIDCEQSIKDTVVVSNSGISSRRWKTKIEEITKMPPSMRRNIGDVMIPVQSAEYNINPTGNSVILGLLGSTGQEIAVKVMDKRLSSMNPKLVEKLNRSQIKHHFLLQYAAIEETGNKVYLASELCDYTLEEYIHIVGLSHNHDPLSANKLSWQLLKGLHYIHSEFGIAHGNIKPQNIFVDFDGKLCLGGYGVTGVHRLNRVLAKPSKKVCERFWKATECLADSEDSEPTTASDVQVAGMLIYYILTGGKHPYGENPYEIEVNILQNWGQMAFISDEANDLISAMLFSDISARPTVDQCLGHPFFWSDEKRFRLILIAGSDVLKEMKTGMAVTGTGSTTMIDFLNVVPTEDVSQDWMSVLDPVVLKDMRSFRQYKNTLAELVLFLYNCCLHFDKMSPSAREVMDDPCRYFLARFPNLFMAVHRAIKVSDRTSRTCYKPFYCS